MNAAGWIMLLIFLGGCTSFSWRTYGRARVAGDLPLPKGTPQRARQTAAVMWKQARTDHSWLPGKPQLPPAAARATTAMRKIAGSRQPQPGKPGARGPFRRLVIPKGSAAAFRPNSRKKQPVTTGADGVPQARKPVNGAGEEGSLGYGLPGDKPRHRPVGAGDGPRGVDEGLTGNSTTAPQGGTMPATSGGGAASDFMSATTRVIAEAEAGGIQSKARGGLVMGEGLKQLAAAMEQHARHLQDTGQYPVYVWEPWRQAAAMAHASASKVTEAGNAAAELARRPMGEANGHAPHRDELNKR